MSIATLVTKKTIHVICPHCNKGEFGVGHMLQQLKNKWIWSCDECGERIQFTWDGESQELNLEKQPPRSLKGLALVRYTGSEDLYFLVDTIHSVETLNTPEGEESTRYYIEEQTCPTNLISCPWIIYKGDADPHGILKYVKSITLRELCEKYQVTQEVLLDSNNSYVFDYFKEAGAECYEEFGDVLNDN